MFQRWFVVFILFFSGVVSAQEFLLPSSFLEDTLLEIDYETAFLVTEGDTLITWNKLGNQTSMRYLNSKITKTVWEDSVEVCHQEGFMLEDFQVSCLRSDKDSNVISRTWKNVEEFRYARKSKEKEVFYIKSYTNGLKLKGYVNLENEIRIEPENYSKHSISNVDSLFEITSNERGTNTAQEILVYFTRDNKFQTISNLSEFNTFRLIEGLNAIKYSSAESHVYFIKGSKRIKKNSKHLFKKTTFSFDLE